MSAPSERRLGSASARLDPGPHPKPPLEPATVRLEGELLAAVDAYMADAAARGVPYASRSAAVTSLLELGLEEAAIARLRPTPRPSP